VVNLLFPRFREVPPRRPPAAQSRLSLPALRLSVSSFFFSFFAGPTPDCALRCQPNEPARRQGQTHGPVPLKVRVQAHCADCQGGQQEATETALFSQYARRASREKAACKEWQKEPGALTSPHTRFAAADATAPSKDGSQRLSLQQSTLAGCRSCSFPSADRTAQPHARELWLRSRGTPAVAVQGSLTSHNQQARGCCETNTATREEERSDRGDGDCGCQRQRDLPGRAEEGQEAPDCKRQHKRQGSRQEARDTRPKIGTE